MPPAFAVRGLPGPGAPGEGVSPAGTPEYPAITGGSQVSIPPSKRLSGERPKRLSGERPILPVGHEVLRDDSRAALRSARSFFTAATPTNRPSTHADIGPASSLSSSATADSAPINDRTRDSVVTGPPVGSRKASFRSCRFLDPLGNVPILECTAVKTLNSSFSTAFSLSGVISCLAPPGSAATRMSSNICAIVSAPASPISSGPSKSKNLAPSRAILPPASFIPPAVLPTSPSNLSSFKTDRPTDPRPSDVITLGLLDIVASASASARAFARAVSVSGAPAGPPSERSFCSCPSTTSCGSNTTGTAPPSTGAPAAPSSERSIGCSGTSPGSTGDGSAPVAPAPEGTSPAFRICISSPCS